MARMYVVLKYDVSNPLTPDLYKHAPYSIVETWDDHKWDAPYYEVVDYFTNLKKARRCIKRHKAGAWVEAR